MGRFTVISGVEHAGIGPLYKAIAKHPHVGPRLRALIPYTSRQPQGKEVDGKEFFFRSRGMIEGMRSQPSRYIVFNTKHNINAIDINQIKIILKMPGLIGFMPLLPEVGAIVALHPAVKDLAGVSSVFISPFTLLSGLPLRKAGDSWRVNKEVLREITTEWVKTRAALVANPGQIESYDEAMIDYGAGEAKKVLDDLGHKSDEERVKRQVELLMEQLRHATNFKYVVSSLNWSGHPNWKKDSPAGYAGGTYKSVLEIIQGYSGFTAETWPGYFFEWGDSQNSEIKAG